MSNQEGNDSVWLVAAMLLGNVCICGTVQTDVDGEQCSRLLSELLGCAFRTDTTIGEMWLLAAAKVFVVIVCYGKHMYHVILYYIPWSWKDVSQRRIENAIFTRLFESHRCSFRRRVKKLFELRGAPCRRALENNSLWEGNSFLKVCCTGRRKKRIENQNMS